MKLKNKYAILLALLFAWPAAAGTFTAYWHFRDLASNGIALKQVVVQPIAPYGVDGNNLIITGDRRTSQSDSSGFLGMTNLFNGRSYRITVSGPSFVTTFTNSFDTNVTGLVNGADPLYMAAPLVDGNISAYSRTQADARFHLVAGDASTNANFYGTLKFLGASTSGYVWTATNASGEGHWAASSGVGSTLWDSGSGTIYPSGASGSENGWASDGDTIYPD